MEDPEAYLRDLTAPLARAREGEPWPAARFSVEAVANAFVVLGLLPAARAAEILAAQRPVLQAAGLRVGTEIGELSVSRGARGLEQARAAAPATLRGIPLAVAAGPVRCRLGGGQDVVLTWITLTPEGFRIRYYADGPEDDGRAASVAMEEVDAGITGLSITDDTGQNYLVPTGNVHSIASGRRSASGRMVWIPEGEFLAVPAAGQAGARDGRAAVRWVEFSADAGQSIRAEIPPPAAVPAGTAQPPWPTPAECYLAQFAPPAADWSAASAATGPVEFDTAAIQTAVADALLAVGALPSGSPVLTGIRDRVHGDWRQALSDQQMTLVHTWASDGPTTGAGLAVRLPFSQATAVIENITVREDMVSVRLYGHPWAVTGSWPMITPSFRVTAVDDTGVHHEGEPGDGSASIATQDGTGMFWLWPPVAPQATQLRVTVSTLWEAAWAVMDIPGR
jgi:hypothetical protein